MSAHAATGREIAEQLYELLRAIDRASPREMRKELPARVEKLRARCAELLESEAAREAALEAALGSVLQSLDDLCTRLRTGVCEQSAFLSFRTAAAPRYEAFVLRLRTVQGDAPSLRPENVARSLFHIASASVAAGFVLFAPWSWVIGVATGFFIFAWGWEIGRRFIPALHRLALRVFAPVAHPHEAYRVNSSTWYATALLPLALFFEPLAGLMGVLALGFGDPAAGWVGRRFGRVRLRSGRSLEGSLGFVAAAFVVCFAALAFAHGHLPLSSRVLLALTAAVAGAVAELVSTRVDDNLSIPLATALAVTGVGALLP